MHDVDLDPPQPDEVARAVAALVQPPRLPVDPWWASGLAATQESPVAQSDVIARPRRTRGAERA